MMFRSIRSRLTLWSAVVMGVAATALVLFVYLSFIHALRSESDQNLKYTAGSFVTSVTSEEPEADAPQHALRELRETANAFRSSNYEFIVVDNSGAVVAKTADIALPTGPESSDGALRDYSANGDLYRVYDRSLRLGFQNFHLFVFRPSNDRIALENRLLETVAVGLPLAILVAAFGSYALVRRGLRPMKTMSEHADRITSRNLHERLPITNEADELGQLARTFNQLLDRLGKAFDQQRRFMADASHELRTPLAIVHGESEVALLKSDRSSDDYKESLRIVNDESKRLTKIVDDLFTLARADSGQIHADLRELYADEVLADCVHSIRTLAENRYIAIELRGHELPVKGDESLLRRLFINLLDNAIKYNYYGGRVGVETRGRTVRISNTGPMIPEDLRDQVFERFVRADKARSADRETLTSGAGLGLSIAKVIADIHHADVSYEHIGVENIFSVTFPD